MSKTYAVAWSEADTVDVVNDAENLEYWINRRNPYDPLPLEAYAYERGLRLTDAPALDDIVIVDAENPQRRLLADGAFFRYAVRRAASGQRVVGPYDVVGTDIDGKIYKGVVHAIEAAGARLQIIWRIAQQESRGFALCRDGRLVISFKLGERTGLAHFALAADGSLNGEWTMEGATGTGVETWTPRRPMFRHLV